MSDLASGSAASEVAEPLVTVVLVCFNHGEFVEQALRSILSQSYTRMELIVTDDASSDDSVAIIKRLLDDAPWPTKLVANATNRGLCTTLNAAMAQATGKYVTMMSADDWMEPDRVAREVEQFEELTDAYGLIHTDMHLVDLDGNPIGDWLETGGPAVGEDAFVDLVEGCNFATPSVMYRRSVLAEVGPYDETLPAEDFDMLLRLARQTRFFFLPVPLTNWRINPESMSRRAGRIGRYEYYLPSLAKHYGISKEHDDLIAERMSTLAAAVYVEGGSRRLAARYLVLAGRKHLHRRAVAYAVPSNLGIPGALANYAGAQIARITTTFRSTR